MTGLALDRFFMRLYAFICIKNKGYI